MRDRLTTGEATTEFAYGDKPLVPIMGDWDGNGSETPGTFEGGVFKLSNTIPPGAPAITVTFGDPRGFPPVGDFNGDESDDLAGGAWEFRVELGGPERAATRSTAARPSTRSTSGWARTCR